MYMVACTQQQYLMLGLQGELQQQASQHCFADAPCYTGRHLVSCFARPEKACSDLAKTLLLVHMKAQNMGMA